MLDTVKDKQPLREDTHIAVQVSPPMLHVTDDFILGCVYLWFVALMLAFMVYIVYLELSSETTQVQCPDYM